MTTQSRWKSVPLWTAITAQALALLVVTGVIGPHWSDAITALVTAVLQAGVAFGILNNPTDKTGF